MTQHNEPIRFEGTNQKRETFRLTEVVTIAGGLVAGPAAMVVKEHIKGKAAARVEEIKQKGLTDRAKLERRNRKS